MTALVAALYFFYVSAIGTFSTLAVALATQLILSRRFSVFAKAAQRVSAGELDLEIKSKGSDGLGQFTGEFNAMARKLKEREAALNQYLEQLWVTQNELYFLNEALESRVVERTTS